MYKTGLKLLIKRLGKIEILQIATATEHSPGYTFSAPGKIAGIQKITVSGD